MNKIEEAMIAHWGTRCADTEPGCPCCDAWAEYDRLVSKRVSAEAGNAVPALHDPEGHWGDFIKSAVAAANEAMQKYPQPNYVISKVAEEAGEVVKAAIHCAEGRETAEHVRAEMRQLIAMLFRLWVEGDQVHGLHPVSAIKAATHP